MSTINLPAKIITINDDFVDQRLDNFLFNKLKNIPKSRIYRMIRNGEVRANKHRVKPLYRLKFADQIRIPPLTAVEAPPAAHPSDTLVKRLTAQIIYEDAAILVLNKPAGIAAHGGSGVNFGAIEILRYARPDLNQLELVHRLDRDTSGCLMFAKKKNKLRELQRLIAAGRVIKKYLLLVRGEWIYDTKNATFPLKKLLLPSGERIVIVDPQGKPAHTIFRKKQLFSNSSLLEAELKTGRTHQIRVHAAKLNYPIAGDPKYGDEQFAQEMEKFSLKRMFLHAFFVAFTWESGETCQITAPLGDDLTACLKQLTAPSNSKLRELN